MIVDLFAGIGGWDLAAQNLGQKDLIGLEWDKACCQTRSAASLPTVRTDVSKYPTEPFRGKLKYLIASPPCQAFSVAGKRLGLEDVRGQLVYEVLRWSQDLDPEWIACEQTPLVLPIWKMFAHELGKMGYKTWTGILNAADFGVPQTRTRAILMASKNRFNPPEPTHSRNPSGSLFGDLKPWVTMADALGWGLTKRPAGVVAATTDRGGPHGLDGGSGARALYEKARAEGGGWIDTRRGISSEAVDPGAEPAPTVTSRTGNNWVMRESEPPEERKFRLNTGRDWKEGEDRDSAQTVDPTEEPAPCVTGKSGGQWLLKGGGWALHNRHFDPEGEPCPTVMFGHDASNWAWERPATTVVSEFRPDIIAAPGYRTDPKSPRQEAEGSVKVTVQEVALLQTFPADYPWQGSKTNQFRQVGNAIPVKLAEAILRELI